MNLTSLLPSCVPILIVLGLFLAMGALFLRLKRRYAAELERYHLLVDTANEGISMTDADFRIVFTNQRWADMLGYTVEEMNGMPIDQLVFEEERADHARRMAERRSGRAVPYERRWRRKDGQALWTLVTPRQIMDAHGKFQGTFAMMIDIGERKRHEAEISRLATVVHTSRDGIVTVGLDGIIQTWNPAAQEMLGYAPGEVIGRPLTMLAPPGREEEVAGNIEKLRRGQSLVYDGKRRKKDGSLIDVTLVLSPIRDDAGQVTGFSGIYHDISKRLVLERMIRQSEKLAAVGRLASGLAHEINNPLNIVLGYAQRMERHLPPNDPNHAAVTAIVKESTRCTELVRELYRYSRVEDVGEEVVELGQLARLAMVLLWSRSKDQKVNLWAETSPEPVRVRANPEQLMQVAVNLGHNALDAMPEGGSLVFTTARKGEDQAVLEVRDTGMGIPEALHAKVFEPFFTTKPAGQGAGLGLSLAYEIVTRHGGEIELVSAENQGSTFRVRLPLTHD